MTANRRIVLNIVATYGRSLFALACGLFTSRWVLMSLGQVDYGLFGVVGVLTSFVGFFNGILSVSVSRFYAYCVGQSATAEDKIEALEQSRRWFNTALLVHTVIPIILIIVGYPCGVWAIENWLEIPVERVMACKWVFRVGCISCFVSMVNVPFNAMYFAKQYIAELTIYSFVQTFVNIMCLYYMVSHPRDWLIGYSIVVCAITILPQIIICLRALRVFPECKFVRKYFLELHRLPELFKFVGWQTFGLTGQLVKGQGIAVLINKAFGAKVNAAMTVANSVNTQAATLSSAMLSAFTPAITQAYGAGLIDEVRRLAFRASKFGVALILIFVVPLIVDLDLVLTLWLKDPPMHSNVLCLGVVVALLCEKSTYGHMIAMNARGQIAAYQAVVGTVILCSLPIAWMLVTCGCGVVSVAIALIVTAVLASLGRIYFSRCLVGMGFYEWMVNLVTPNLIVIAAAMPIGYYVRGLMEPTFLRLLGVTCGCEFVLIPLIWTLVLEKSEREYVLGIMHRCASRVFSREY